MAGACRQPTGIQMTHLHSPRIQSLCVHKEEEMPLYIEEVYMLSKSMRESLFAGPKMLILTGLLEKKPYICSPFWWGWAAPWPPQEGNLEKLLIK